MRLLFLFTLMLMSGFLFAQIPDSVYTGVDTTLASYQMGRKIGAWLPFLLLFGVVLLYIKKAYRHGNGEPKHFD